MLEQSTTRQSAEEAHGLGSISLQQSNSVHSAGLVNTFEQSFSHVPSAVSCRPANMAISVHASTTSASHTCAVFTASAAPSSTSLSAMAASSATLSAPSSSSATLSISTFSAVATLASVGALNTLISEGFSVSGTFSSAEQPVSLATHASDENSSLPSSTSILPVLLTTPTVAVPCTEMEPATSRDTFSASRSSGSVTGHWTRAHFLWASLHSRYFASFMASQQSLSSQTGGGTSFTGHSSQELQSTGSLSVTT
mmetsp:Transcript_23857/g.81330  ORF Transcript_23857/g.81330 Transcript_23857/m.81330 type:complete len:254 (+) Transcript_23857:814-1575(+)